MIPAIARVRKIFQIVRYEFSSLNLKTDLFASQFHLQGHRHFQRSRELTRNPTDNLLDIQKATLSLQKLRMNVQKAKENTDSDILSEQESEFLRQYLNSYLKLIEAIKESKLNQQWFFQMAGWYNIQAVFHDLVQQLFDCQNKKKHFMLIQALSWMNPNVYKISPDLQFYEIQRYNKYIDNYYKELNNSIPLIKLKQIQHIFQESQTYYKARFYQKFVHSNLSNILKLIDLQKRDQINDIVWLYKMYVGNYNDKKDIIGEFDRFLGEIESSLLNQRSLLILMEIYSSKGRIDKKIYEKYLKQFVKPKKESSIHFLVKSLSFVLHSEVQDHQMIDLLIKFISKTLQDYKIKPQIMLQIHYLCHYMFVKGIKFDLQKSVLKQLHECCRQHEGNGTIARGVAIALDDKGRRQGKNYYQSECLRKQRQVSMIKVDVGQQIRKTNKYKKYKKVRICSIDIDICVAHKQTNEVVVLENSFHKFQHSKRLSRQFLLRQAILSHYGVKVNYLQSKESFRRMPIQKDENLDQLIR